MHEGIDGELNNTHHSQLFVGDTDIAIGDRIEISTSTADPMAIKVFEVTNIIGTGEKKRACFKGQGTLPQGEVKWQLLASNKVFLTDKAHNAFLEFKKKNRLNDDSRAILFMTENPFRLDKVTAGRLQKFCDDHEIKSLKVAIKTLLDFEGGDFDYGAGKKN